MVSRLVLSVVVLAVVLAVVLPVSAQGPEPQVARLLDEEVGSPLWRCWCQEKARIAAIDLNAEVGGYQWRCWCGDQVL